MSLELTNSQYKLENLCLQITDGKHGDCENQENSGYYFVSVKDIDEGEINYSNARQITKYDFEETDKRTNLENEDILITNSGTIGKFVFVNSPLSRKTTFQKSVAIIKPDKNKILPKFLYYYLISEKRRLIEYAGGTTQKNLLLRDIRNFEVEIPNEIQQKRIIHILNDIDQLIKVKKTLNKNLTNIVLLLFKNWFVDFNFLNENNKPYKNDNGELKDSILGLIPKDWNVDSLGKYVEIDRGFSYKGKYLSEEGIPLINLGNILPNSEFRLEKLKFYSGEFDKKYKVNVGDILVANTDLTQNRLVLGSPIIVPSLIDEKDIIYSHHINRLSNFKLPKFYIFYNLLSERYNHMVSGYATGTTVLAISKESITNYKILIPPEELIFKFDELAKNIEKIKDNNLIEMEKLTKLRNILLPKLMSGEIDVSQLDYLNDSIER